jgi:MOSC domain-containing protein YiiM
MQEVDRVTIDAGRGLEGDHKGGRFPSRGVTLLARESWDEALAALADLAGPVALAWTVRRANLLVEGIVLPRARGAIVRVGPVLLEVTAQTFPCRRMEQAHAGLMKALAPEWRGGVCCRVVTGGVVEIGDAVELISSPPEPRARLPG